MSRTSTTPLTAQQRRQIDAFIVELRWLARHNVWRPNVALPSWIRFARAMRRWANAEARSELKKAGAR